MPDWQSHHPLWTVHNSWLILMDSSNSTRDLKMKFSDYLSTSNASLRYDSQVYALGYGDNHTLTLIEAYKIGPDNKNLTINEASDQ